ncbi:MAG: hypothetical protein HY904_05510 [Deltaproteobacteria bacterium]|nr:hypothetical protein [Deltaproteobacteria bacterium]
MGSQNLGWNDAFTIGSGYIRSGVTSMAHDQAPSPAPVAELTRFDPREDHPEAVLVAPPSDSRNWLALALWDAGVEVSVFSTPADAEGTMSAGRVDLVVLDASLGPAFAVQVAAWLRSTGRGHVRILVVGDQDPVARQAMLAGGVTWTAPRPTDHHAFARQLSLALGSRVRAPA